LQIILIRQNHVLEENNFLRKYKMGRFKNELRHGSGAEMILDCTRLLLAFKKAPILNELLHYERKTVCSLKKF
jgi:hypothetical protein